MSAKNLLLYLLPSVCMVNSHYYGILFIMANYLVFVLWMACYHGWNLKKFIIFTLANGILALSFLPFFLYMLLYEHYTFIREFTPQIGHGFLMGVIAVFAAAFLVFRKTIMEKVREVGILKQEQFLFVGYLVLVPACIFALSFVISFVWPLITFRYLWPVNAPFFFALAAVSVMLENAPQNAAYYGFASLPAYSAGESYDVLYGLNDIFHLHEMEMYDKMYAEHLDADNMLKIYFDYEYPRGDGGMIFKKYNPNC